MLTIRDDGLSDFKFYYYSPSMAAAVIFIILFGVATALHTVQMFRTKTWFLVPFVIGGICKSNPAISEPKKTMRKLVY